MRTGFCEFGVLFTFRYSGLPNFNRMKRLLPLLGIALLFLNARLDAQLQITTSVDATLLAQKIAGEGVTVSNATIVGGSVSSGFFRNIGGTNISIDSGVVLSSGRVLTDGFASTGMNGNGTTQAFQVDADNTVNLPGDADLANAIGVPLALGRDACVLEFDFVPVGDTIRFNYVFSSEEYTPDFVCDFNDAFAFFISGPGITGLKNIALVPGTTTPVSIFNVNNVTDPFDPLCPNNPQYYVDNRTNTFFTHDGHTVTLTAVSEVQPCERYHLKLVIMDVGDGFFDSGVFLEAGSLRSDPVHIDNQNPLNDFNLPYLAEGCTPGAINIHRDAKKPYPQSVTLSFGGTAINGVDVQTIPTTVTIPAGDSVVTVPIVTIADMIPEGHEVLKIFVAIGNTCSGIQSDSILVELRDVDMLAINPPDSTKLCRNGSIMLEAVTGYTDYTWTNGASLSSSTIHNPIASPASGSTNYICTATIGDCIARDSVLVTLKTMELVDKGNVQCNSGLNGYITVSGTGWEGNVTYAVNNEPFQASNTISGLGAGTYWVKMKDESGCIDSIQVELIQENSDVTLTYTTTPSTCSITPDGRIEVTPAGGSGNFTFSSDGVNYQSSNVLVVPEGSYTIYVKDENGCIATESPVVVGKVNTLELEAGADDFMCEGTSYTMAATSNAPTISWAPTSSLTNANTLTPTARPATTTKYYVTAMDGTCSKVDSLIINVWEAPIPDAGADVEICYGITAQLAGAGGTGYSWVPDPSFTTTTEVRDPIVKPDETTSYFLHVIDDKGCKSLVPDEMVVSVTPAVEVFAGNDTLVAIGQPLQLGATERNNSGVSNWEWSPGNYLSDANISNPIATFPSPINVPPYEYTYRVTGTTSIGCQGWDEIKIKVYQGPEIYVPSAFTPNGDGKNDVLYPVPVGLKQLTYFRVFNRWGEEVFFTQDASRGWDGMIGGKGQSNSVYVWVAEGIDFMGNKITRKGMVTLVR